MIAEFLASWPLFQSSYLAGWLIGIVLSLLGVLVVARDQIFLGATVSQASVFGVALGMALGAAVAAAGYPWLRDEVLLAPLGPAFAVLAALATGRAGSGRGESAEAITGWIYLAAASGSVLLLSHSPHGLEEVHRLLASTLIGARAGDVVFFGVFAVVTIMTFCLYRSPLLLLTVDPEMAAAVGLRVELLSRMVWVWIGIAIGTSIRVSGMLYTFGSLVLPPLIAKNTCRQISSMLVVAPLVSLGSGIAAFVIANSWDYPPGQMAVALLSVLLTLAWAWRGAVESGRVA